MKANTNKQRIPTSLPQFKYGDCVRIVSDGKIREGQGILSYFYDGQRGEVQNILHYAESECFGYEIELDTGKKVIMKENELEKIEK